MSSYKVPDNLEVILSHADSTDIVDRLHAGVFLKEKKEKFFIEKNSGANAFELYARGLSVAFENDQQRGLSIALENDQNSWIWTSEGDTEYVIYN
ncbi:lectin-like [Mangifera indica]|uniref:lectin-like n=1 Tax=Mangifera indica TaxID=29780 RepID=UPI001CFC3ACE|nr:lectin-like [Mangifera indica]